MLKTINKIIFIFTLFIFFMTPAGALSFNLKDLKNKENSDIPAVSTEVEIQKVFGSYEKYSNTENMEKLLALYDENYISADNFDKTKLEELAKKSWEAYPAAKYRMKIISVSGNYENATVVVEEHMEGDVAAKISYIKGVGYIESDAVTIYYLKKFYDGWKIISDYIVNEKSSLRYGNAKNVVMKLDAPAILKPKQEYNSILQLNLPKDYSALVSLSNEPIKIPAEKSIEVFRTMKTSGIQERVLRTNNHGYNENVVASICIARTTVEKKTQNKKVDVAGIAFLTTRVNISGISQSLVTESKAK